MKAEEFFQIRRSLKSLRDITSSNYERGTLFSILLQKRIDNVKRRYHTYTSRLPEIAHHWEKYREIPRWIRLPPVMRIKLLMKSLGMTNREIARSFSDPDLSEMSEMIWSAIYSDFIYSPIAVRNQFARGRVGEEIIRNHLEKSDIDFKDESQLRPARKTPDFYIEDGIEINGRNIKWIESKALFGDIKLHRVYSKKQYNQYLEMYGDGIVVYWMGFIDELTSHALIADHTLFDDPGKEFLLKMRVYMADRTAESIAERLNANIFEWNAGDDMRSTEYLREVLKLFDSIRGNVVIGGGDKNLRGILKRMGFQVVVEK